jgi:hypothetical protein
LPDALRLLDARHDVLLMRRESQDDKAKPGPSTYADKTKVPAKPPASKRPAEEPAPAGPSKPQPSAKKPRPTRLPFVEYVRKVCPSLREAVVARHLEDAQAKKALTCPLCKANHFVTRCQRFLDAKNKGKAPVN